MVGIVLVSHSKKLAEAVRELVLQMTAHDFPVAVAGGVGEQHDELGTDAVHISEVLQALNSPEGVLVLMDLGSAVLSAETALELLDLANLPPIRLCPAPLVEGAVAAAVCSQAGGSLDEVAREAEIGLAPKQQQLQPDAADDAANHLPQRQPPTPDECVETVLAIPNEHGLHARPAAALVQTASRFASNVEVANLTSNRGPVSARSLTSLSLLQVRKGDQIKVVCCGSDCRAALQAISELAAAGFGDKTEASSPIPRFSRNVAGEARGFPGSDGIAIGPLLPMRSADIEPGDEPAADAATEMAKLDAAIGAVRKEIANAGNRAGADSILEAQALILSDPIVHTKVQSLLQAGGVPATRAWSEVTRELAAQYAGMDDPYLRERAADVRDISSRVLRRIKGIDAHPAICPETPSILFTEELLPSEASGCDPKRVLGVISARGSATSHSAILLRTLGIPMVVGAAGVGELDAGNTVGLDGSTGEFWINPDAATRATLETRRQLQLERRAQADRARTQPGVTVDGARIEVLANVGNSRDSALAAENGAEGVGLLRTEFLFVSRKQAPTEDEQVQALREIYAPSTGPIIVRSLDVGADKPLTFLPQPEEHNPYLGVRGIRLSLQSPELFLSHLRAILRSGAGHNIWLMFPMVAVAAEARRALQFLERAHQQLVAENVPHLWPIPRGIMIEVPSAALLAGQLAEELDFFSIGTNDLTQYTMAAERGNANVAELQDALHPAVLRLMKSVADAAEQRGRHVSVCGDAASDPVAAAIFAGLGIHSLSVRPNRAAEIKALFRELRLADLKNLAVQALDMASANDVRSVAAERLASVSIGN